MIEKNNKISRKFKEPAFYDLQSEKDYYLLPFRFHRLNLYKEILVNEVGDFLVLPTGTAERIINRKINKEDDEELFGDLISNYFVSEEKIPQHIDVLATRYRTKKSFLDYFTSLHIFVITLRCNHSCHYCQVSRVSEDKSPFDMKREHIDKAISFMMKSPNPYLTMEFQGGESLLAFDNIVYAVEKTKEEAKKRNKKVNYVICTNLTPLNDEILNYCRDNSILISTSLDGPANVHNENRFIQDKNSYEMTIKGINKCREILGFDRVSALLTTSALSLKYPEEIVDEYYAQSFKSIFLRPINPYGFAIRNEKINQYENSSFLEFYKRGLIRVIQYNLKGHFYREDYATIILKKMLTPFPVNFVDLQSPNGMINSVIVYNYDGKVYATDESRMLAEMKDYTFQLGDLDHNTYEEIFYGDKAVQFSEAWLNESLPGCSECAFQAYCGANPVFNWRTQGDIFGYRPTSTFCQRNMEIFRYLFELMSGDINIEKIFRTWVR